MAGKALRSWPLSLRDNLFDESYVLRLVRIYAGFGERHRHDPRIDPQPASSACYRLMNGEQPQRRSD